MTHFDYVRADSLDHAVRLINETAHPSKLLAGGTDILAYLHYQPPDFSRVVDISILPELKIIRRSGGEITLGGGVTFSEAMESPLLQEAAPFLVQACRSVGSPQIRNMGTLGGNVINAAACADSLPVLVCLEALAHLYGPEGERGVPVGDLVLGANSTQIGPGEILTHFTFRAPPAGVKTAFIKLGRRNAQAIARLSMAAMGRLDGGGRIDFVRITPGAAAPRTVRFTEAEAALLGQPYTPECIRAAARQIADGMVAITGWRWSTEYKSKAIITLAERVITQVLSRSADPSKP